MAELKDETLSFRTCDGVCVVTLHAAEITQQVDDMISEKLKETPRSDRGLQVVLDLSNLKFLGSVGMSILVVLLHRVRRAGGKLVLAGLKGHCMDVMRVSELQRAFPIYPDVPGALEALRHG